MRAVSLGTLVLFPRGNLLMALAWSLPTGFDTPLTYFYVVYSQCFLFIDSDETMKDVRIGKLRTFSACSCRTSFAQRVKF